jgi:hypothetical protein
MVSSDSTSTGDAGGKWKQVYSGLDLCGILKRTSQVVGD